MQNIILAFPNRADAASYSGGNWLSSGDLALANLADRDLSLVARSANASAASTQLVCALDRVRTVRVVALLGHNLTLDSRYRLRAADGASFTNIVWDSGWCDVWPAIYDSAVLDWHDSNWWGGRPSEEDVAKYPKHLIVVLPQAVPASHIWLEVVDTTNPAGYVEAARLVVAGQWQPRWNMSWGSELGIKSLTQMVEIPRSGARHYDISPNRRSFAFALDWLDSTEVYSKAFELMREADVHGEVLLIPDPDDSINLYRRAFYATAAKLNPIRRPKMAQYQQALEFEEIL